MLILKPIVWYITCPIFVRTDTVMYMRVRRKKRFWDHISAVLKGMILKQSIS